MAVTVRGQVGPQALQDGTEQGIRQGRSAELIVSELHGQLYEQASRKNVFTAYAAGVATSLAGTAMVGLQLWNGSPVAGGVNCVLLQAGGMVVVTSASLTSVALGFGTGQVSAPGSQTAITSARNNFIGATGPQATALNAGTFTNAPTAALNVLHNTAAIATTGEDQGFSVDLKGAYILPPQTYAAFIAVGAAAAASGMNLHLMWEEVPV